MNKPRGYRSSQFRDDLIVEGLSQQQQYVHPFLTEVVNLPIDVKAYKFISVLTDGAFNPDNTYARSELPQCYLSFNNPDQSPLILNREYLNFPIPRVNQIFLSNTLARTTAPRSWTLETGYENIFIIKHQYPFETYPLIKHNPHFCWSGMIQIQNSKSLWTGIHRPDASFELAVPFVPFGYEKIHQELILTTLNASVYLYSRFYCCDDNYATDLIDLATTTEPNGLIRSITNHSNRIVFMIYNNGVSNAEVCLQIIFMNKSSS